MRVKRHRKDKNESKLQKVAVRLETVTKGKSSSLFEELYLPYNSTFSPLANIVQHLKAFKYCLYKHKNAFSMIR